MKYNTVTETHITEAPRMSDEILNALRQKFPGREVRYLLEPKHNTFAGYKVSGTLTKEEETDVQHLMTDVVEKSLKARELAVACATVFMEQWTPIEVKPHGDKILSCLYRLYSDMVGYVDSHKVDDPVFARKFALDSDEVAKVYHLWHQKKFSEAAMYLLNSSDTTRGGMDSRTYDAIMKHYKVA